MAKPTLQKRPPYLIESVDNALRLLQVLRDQGSIRVKDAAAELGVTPSTAHRLLAMLVYRGFAYQDASRAYLPGASLGAGAVRFAWSRILRDIAGPRLQELARQLDESTNLLIRVDTKVRFLASFEAARPLHVGDRQGTVIPARGASGGKVLLAGLSDATLERMYVDPGPGPAEEAMDPAEFARFLRQLSVVRRDGFAIVDQETEAGVCAIGVSVRGAGRGALAAICVAVPESRAPRLRDPAVLELLRRAQRAIDDDLRDAGVDAQDGVLPDQP